MDTGKITNTLSFLMNDIPFSLKKNYHFCWFEDRLQLLPTHHTDIAHRIYTKVTYKELTKGLTSKEWDQLTTAILKHQKGEPCQTKNQNLLPPNNANSS